MHHRVLACNSNTLNINLDKMKGLHIMKTLIRAFIAIITVVIIISLLIIPAVANENTIVEKESLQFSIKGFEPKPLESNLNKLHLNKRAYITLDDRMGSNLANSETAFNTLLKSFYEAQPEDQKLKEGHYSVSGITKEGFPEYYAGAFINTDLNLVVLLTESMINSDHALAADELGIEVFAESNGIIFSSAEHSYRQLVSLMDDIHKYMMLPAREKDTRFCIYSFSIDDYNNCVIVGMKDIGEENIAAFKETVSNSKALRFYKDEQNIPFSVLNPGQEIDSGTSGASMAFRATIYENNTTKYGFVTAAHVTYKGADVKVNGTTVGTTHNSKYSLQNNSTMDAAFVLLKDGWSVSTSLAHSGTTLTSAIDMNMAQGTPVVKYGQANQTNNYSGRVSGTITSMTHAFTLRIPVYNSYNDYYLYDMIQASTKGQTGDSGGLLISARVGVHIAGVTCSGNSDSTSFTKAINITSGLGLTLH